MDFQLLQERENSFDGFLPEKELVKATSQDQSRVFWEDSSNVPDEKTNPDREVCLEEKKVDL